MTKIKCLKCGDIIESDGHGKWVSCSCNSCYVDEKGDYCRIGGDSKFTEIEKDGKWVNFGDMMREASEREVKK
jgi:hypothetical protein